MSGRSSVAASEAMEQLQNAAIMANAGRLLKFQDCALELLPT
jgi:hypothetical protein